MRVLYLTHSCPYPPNKGDRIRNFHILRHLAHSHQVSLIYPTFSSEDEKHLETLKQWCASIKAVRMSSLIAKFRCALNLFGNKSFTAAYFHSVEMQETVDRAEYDLVLVDCSSMAQYVLGIKKPKLIDFVDVDSDKWRMYAEKSQFPRTLLYRSEYARLRELEEYLVNEFDVSIVISDQEREFLPDSDRLEVVRNGIDLEFFKRQGRIKKEPTLIFTGAMNYFPNIEGVLFFKDQVFPLVQRAIPSVKFIIGGMAPDPCIKRLASDNTIVTGFVPDMRDYIEEAWVSVVPLRIAKGIQNKVLEAMAMEVPVVATSLANQGINAQDRREIMIADDPGQFARAVVELLMNEGLRWSIADHARRFVEKQYSWEGNLAALDRALTRAIGHQDSPQSIPEEVVSV